MAKNTEKFPLIKSEQSKQNIEFVKRDLGEEIEKKEEDKKTK